MTSLQNDNVNSNTNNSANSNTSFGFNVNNSNSMLSSSGYDNNSTELISRILIDTSQKIGELEKELNIIKDKQKKTEKFYDAVTSLSNVAKYVLCMFVAVPLIQAVICGFVVYHLGLDDKLTGILEKVLGWIMGGAVVEILVGVVYYLKLEDRVKALENKDK